jgi:hypothetical protein
MDTTKRSSGYTIPDTDTFMFYLVNNAVNAHATINLPHATVAGKMVILLASNDVTNSGVTAAAQSGDSILTGSGTSASTKLIAISDGNHHWLIVTTAIIQ